MSFDPLARVYPTVEAVLAGRWLQRAREHYASRLAGCRHILIAGDGHGPGVQMALRAAPGAEITVVEASASMISVARERVQRARLEVNRVTWVHADIRKWSPSAGAYDAVLTQFFLDCFPPADVDRISRQLARAAALGAPLLLSDFCIPQTGGALAPGPFTGSCTGASGQPQAWKRYGSPHRITCFFRRDSLSSSGQLSAQV